MIEPMLPILLLAVALLLIMLEPFVPSGGLLTFSSITVFVLAVVLAYRSWGAGGAAAFVAGATVVFPLAVWGIIKLAPHSPLGRRLVSQPLTDEDVTPDSRLEHNRWLGQKGVTVSVMLPAGAIRVAGKTLDAVSEGTTIEQGTPVEIVDVRGNHLVVRAIDGQAVEATNDVPSESPLDQMVPDPFDESAG